MDPNKEQLCRDWLARRTAILDQREKRNEALYAIRPPEFNLMMLNDLEAQRFAVEIHRWELEQMLATGEDIDTYPQPTRND